MKLIQSVKRKIANSEKDKRSVHPAGQEASNVDNPNPFALPKLREAPAADRAELFRKKMQACCILHDFHDMNQRGAEPKRQTLLELVEYVNNTRHCFNESLIQDVAHMVGSNIFRTMVSTKTVESVFDPEDEEPALEISWPHLQLVYEFFLRFVVSNDVDSKIAKRFVDQTFVQNILELFNSEDPRERDYLKTILHRIYGKFMQLRSFIRRGIQHVFFQVIYDCEVHNGISELLDILGSIINGFAIPLKDEHKDFLTKALIPLHKVKFVARFNPQLIHCMTEYIDKDARLACDIISAMLKFWPVTLASKQVLFVSELEEILEMMEPSELRIIQDQLFGRIAQCIMSPHFQVAERTLLLWNNDYFVRLVNQDRIQVYPLIVGAIYKNSKQHWNQAVQTLTFHVLKVLQEADAVLFEQCFVKCQADEEVELKRMQESADKWQKLETLFADRNKNG